MTNRRRPKIKPDYKAYLNKKQVLQEDTINYLGIKIVGRFNFSARVEYAPENCIKLMHALSKSAKVNWGLRHDVLRIVYSGQYHPFFHMEPQLGREPAT
jgi:hypothetical protein